MDVLRFTGTVYQFGHAGLHPESHFILRDAGFDFRVADTLVEALVQGGESIELAATLLPRNAGRVREMQHRVARGAKLHALVTAGQKARAPEAREQALV